MFCVYPNIVYIQTFILYSLKHWLPVFFLGVFFSTVIYTPRRYMVQGKETSLEIEVEVKNTCSLKKKKMFQSPALTGGRAKYCVTYIQL